MQHPSAISQLERFSHLLHRCCHLSSFTRRTDWARARFSGFPPSLPVRTMSERLIRKRKMKVLCNLKKIMRDSAARIRFLFISATELQKKLRNWYQCKSRGTQLMLKNKTKICCSVFSVIGVILMCLFDASQGFHGDVQWWCAPYQKFKH